MFNDFINYVHSFYGPEGLYDQGRTKEQISYALLMYLDDCNDPCGEYNMSWGDGDSLDLSLIHISEPRDLSTSRMPSSA